MSDSVDNILEVRNLQKHFPIRKGFLKRQVGTVRAVDDVTFSIPRGKTVGLVGESGSGKTTAGRALLRAHQPTSGSIRFFPKANDAIEVEKLDRDGLKNYRKYAQMIFQDPFSSLNPRMPVLDLIAEPLQAQGWSKKDYVPRVRELLKLVGLDPSFIRRYPHAFSGGQRQRIGIARALALQPELIVADESVSALDVSVQAQILNLLKNLQKQFGLSYLFIAHDLSVVRYLCDEVAVMYMGKLVETAETNELFTNPQHPYTSILLQAAPPPDPKREWHAEKVAGEVGDIGEDVAGCPFADRCAYAVDRCRTERPLLREIDTPGSSSEIPHRAACHRSEEIPLPGV